MSDLALDKKLRSTGLLKLIGHTPMIKVESLSQLTGRDIFMKCENFNPGAVSYTHLTLPTKRIV